MPVDVPAGVTRSLPLVSYWVAAVAGLLFVVCGVVMARMTFRFREAGVTSPWMLWTMTNLPGGSGGDPI